MTAVQLHTKMLPSAALMPMNDRLALQSVIIESGASTKLAGPPINEMQNAFPFLNNEENKELVAQIDSAIDSMYEDGTIKEISMKYSDMDITEKVLN